MTAAGGDLWGLLQVVRVKVWMCVSLEKLWREKAELCQRRGLYGSLYEAEQWDIHEKGLWDYFHITHYSFMMHKVKWKSSQCRGDVSGFYRGTWATRWRWSSSRITHLFIFIHAFIGYMWEKTHDRRHRISSTLKVFPQLHKMTGVA